MRPPKINSYFSGQALIPDAFCPAGHEDIYFENIMSDKFTPERNQGILKADAMKEIHVIRRSDGAIVKGMDGLPLLYDAVGLGWVFMLAKLPLLGQVRERTIPCFSYGRRYQRHSPTLQRTG